MTLMSDKHTRETCPMPGCELEEVHGIDAHEPVDQTHNDELIAANTTAANEAIAPRPWRALTNVGIRTPAVRVTVKDGGARTRIETDQGDLVLGTGEWILMALEVWQETLAKALRAAQPEQKKRTRN
jgi:hypothetical protein